MERRHALRAQLADARAQTDSLFELISPQALYSRPVTERHRLIFYYGHFDAFDWNLLARRGMSAPAFNSQLDRLFERGIDPPPGHAPSDTAADWPQVPEVSQYRMRTRQWIDDHVNEMDPWLLQMAVEHRQMHAETFAYLMHNLPYDQKRGVSDAEHASRPAPRNPLIDVNGSQVTLGKNADTFGWDNEHLEHQVAVSPFRMTQFKISNGEYLEFVRAGAAAPNFWVREGDAWMLRLMFQLVPLPLDCPVWVTWREAEAYAKWRGLSLPAEAEFQVAAQVNAPDARRDNFGFARWDPIPVDAAGGCDGPSQLTGNGWEWTRDHFAPFAGFEPHPFYPGYSSDFFDGEHYVMKGASPRTAALLTRPSFRNWFRPDYPHMYAGFRLVEN